MTFQPPPPPPGGTPPPPPPPGQWGPPPGQGGSPAKFDAKTVNPLDWALVGIGALTFIFSFINFYVASVDTSGNCPGSLSNLSSPDASASAWHEIVGAGFFAWFAMLFAVVGAVITAMTIMGNNSLKLPLAPRLAALAAFAAAALFEIIAIFVVPGDSYSQSFGGCTVEAGIGHGFGFWVSLILILAGLVIALMRLQQTGGQLPGALANVPNIGGYGPQGRGGPGGGGGLGGPGGSGGPGAPGGSGGFGGQQGPPPGQGGYGGPPPQGPPQGPPPGGPGAPPPPGYGPPR